MRNRVWISFFTVFTIFTKYSAGQNYSMTFKNQWKQEVLFKCADVIDVYYISPLNYPFPESGVQLKNSLGRSPIRVRKDTLAIRLGQPRVPGIYEIDIIDSLVVDRNYLFVYSLNEKKRLVSKINYKKGKASAGRELLTATLDTLDKALSKIAKDSIKKRIADVLSDYSSKFDSSSAFGFAAIISRENPVIHVSTELDGATARDSSIQFLDELTQILIKILATEKSDISSTSTFIDDAQQELTTSKYWLQPSNYESAETHLYETVVSPESVKDIARYYPDNTDISKDVLWFGFDKKGSGQFIVVFRIVKKKNN